MALGGYDPLSGSSSASSSSRLGSVNKLSAQSPSRRLVHRRAKGLLARTTCIHTQLRDLLVCPDVPGEVVASSYQSMAKYSFPSSPRHPTHSYDKRNSFPHKSPPTGLFSNLSGRKEHLQSLNFIPNVLVKGCGLLAAGGHQAEISILSSPSSSSSFHSSSSAGNWCIKTHIGHSINNSIHISPDPFHPLSIPQLRISNNDSHIYFYELHHPKRWGSLEMTDEFPGDNGELVEPELVPRGKVRLETPVNHSSTSADGRRMVAVGDTNQVFLFDINAGGQHTLIDTVEASNDASFSTSWSRTGLQFAVASQDGLVSIFDVRSSSSPMKVFPTHYRNSPSSSSGSGTGSGAARVVKYSPGPNELLAFSEQRGFVHLVDARTYDYVEEINLLETEVEECGRPVAVNAGNGSGSGSGSGVEGRGGYDYRDEANERTRSLAIMELERRNRQERHPLLLGATRTGSTTTSRGQQTSANLPGHLGYSGSRSVIARDPNPWDTFSTDDVSNNPDALPSSGPPYGVYLWRAHSETPSYLRGVEQGGTLVSLTHRRDASRRAREEEQLAPDDDEAPAEEGEEGVEEEEEEEEDHGDEMEWQDCPIAVPDNSGSTLSPSADVYPNTAPWRDSRAAGQERALPSLIPDLDPDPGLDDTRFSHPTTSSSDPRRPPSTVFQLLSQMTDHPAHHPSDLYAPTGSHYMSPASSSITGLDWDPTGRYLYASMERVVLEWRINEDGRRCVPSASVL